MSKKNKVLVLMSTYNGEKYLRDQIDSILNQKDVDVFLHVSDDKSNDHTVDILKEYSCLPNFSFSINKINKGFAYNFLDALFAFKNGPDFDYYAFSDQDDYWEEDKLISGIQLMNNKDGCLYYSNLYLVDENLNKYAIQDKESIKKNKRYSVLVGGVASGCTMIMDRTFFKKVMKYYPSNVSLHDYWVFLIGYFTSTTIYDFTPHILYRQHSTNQIGSNGSFFQKHKLKNFLEPKFRLPLIIKEFINGYKDEININDLKVLEMVAHYNDSFKNRLKLFFSFKVRRSRYNLLFKVRVLFGKY